MMAAADFAKSMPRVLAYEGGYSNHPRDPGGVTLEGIIQRVYDGYRDNEGLERQPLTAAMRGTAEWIRERDEIYRRQYWNKVRGDALPPGVDFVVFDGAVNSGPGQSVKWLQRALGIDADGVIGEATIAAVNAHPDHDALIADICARRMAFLKQLKTFDAFGVGWTRRVSNVKATGQAWASGSVGPQPVAAHLYGGDAKAVASDLSESAVRPGQAATASTASTVGYGTVDQVKNVVAQASDSLTPLADTLQIVKYAMLGLALVAAGFTLYGIWRSFRVKKAAEGELTAHVPEEEFA